MDDQPTPEPSDFAKLNAVYAATLAAVLLATRGRDRDPIALPELLPMGAAAFAIAKAVSREKIGSWIREPLTGDDHRAASVDSERLRRAVGELVTCSRCVGAWSALGVVGLRAASPSAGRLVTAVFATSALNDWGQAGFRLLCGASDNVGEAARERAAVSDGEH
jgi:hypothetical protein